MGHQILHDSAATPDSDEDEINVEEDVEGNGVKTIKCTNCTNSFDLRLSRLHLPDEAMLKFRCKDCICLQVDKVIVENFHRNTLCRAGSTRKCYECGWCSKTFIDP